MVVVLLSVLLTGCFSYKKADLNQTEFRKEDTYRVTTVGKHTKKGKFYSASDSILILKGRRGDLFEISIEEIREVKKRKFSLGKTIALPVGITVALTSVVVIGLSDWGPAINFN